MTNSEHLTEKVEDIIDGLLNNEATQKKLFMLGGLIGQGIKTGIGISSGTSGKFKLQDVIGQIVSKYLLGQQPQPETSQAGGMG